MFTELLTILNRPGDTVLITVGRADKSDKLVLTVTPRPAKEPDGELSKMITQPIQIIASADELDADLPTHLKAHADRLMSLRGTFEDLDRRLKEAQAKAGATLSTATAKAAPANTPAEPALF